MRDLLAGPWPWYVAGPLVGLIVPALLLLGGKKFGISSSLRHLCAATVPARIAFFRYDWRRTGAWNLAFAAGLLLGGTIAATLLPSADPTIDLAPATREDLAGLGIADFAGLVPADLFSWRALRAGAAGWVCLLGGGFLLGLGARWAGGCTSGHAITGLADRQLPSLVAVLGFFAGGLAVTYLLLPLLL